MRGRSLVACKLLMKCHVKLSLSKCPCMLHSNGPKKTSLNLIDCFGGPNTVELTHWVLFLSVSQQKYRFNKQKTNSICAVCFFINVNY